MGIEVTPKSSYDASSQKISKLIHGDVFEESNNVKQAREGNYIHQYSDSVEIIEPSQKQEEGLENNSKDEEDILNDTPEIEDLLFDAERNDMPAYVIKTLEETRRRKENVVLID